jgi:hypothetical protein
LFSRPMGRVPWRSSPARQLKSFLAFVIAVRPVSSRWAAWNSQLRPERLADLHRRAGFAMSAGLTPSVSLLTEA